VASRIRTNCPRDCYDGCGILVEKRDDGSARVLGDPDHPVSRGRLCSKCAIAYNGVWQDAGARLGTPMRRVGTKGEARFEPVSWREALDEIAARLNATLASDGPEAILETHYSGTLSMIASAFPDRFFNHLGTAIVDPDTICNAAGHVAWHLMFGNSVMGFDPRTARDSACIVVWGANPSHSAPHAHEHWLAEAPGRVIVVDPVRTETAAAADLHLQPRPGTDAALAFSILHAIRARGGFDQAYIAAHVFGAEEIAGTLDDCTPEWGESRAGVPAADIVRAAELYCAGPALLWCGQGLQRQPTGGNVMRAAALLPALTGNVGKPGAGFYYLNYTPMFAGVDLGWLSGSGLSQGERKTVSHMDLAARLAASDEFKALISWNTNPLASAPRQGELRAAFARGDLFTVVVDCFMTDTARYADYVLPAASFLEFDDLTYSYFHLLMGAQSKVNEPIGESLPNQEIFRRLARAMGLTEPALFEDDQAMISQLMEQLDLGYGHDELEARGYFYLGDEPMLMFADNAFGTPSGKIEIASAQAVAMGLPRTPEPRADPAPASDRLRLLSPASKWRLNDSYANDPHIAERAGPADVLINADDAARFGIADGARVELRNETGAVRLLASIDDRVQAGTALSYKGRWPSTEGDATNVNFVHTPRKADMGESTSVHGTEVTISTV
jgi:anaerobic selenocysteine-containing dehydrogenase